MSVQDKYQILEMFYPNLLNGIGALIQKGKLSKRFKNVTLTREETLQLIKAKELCELKIIELWDDIESENLKKLCSTYYDISVLFPIDTNYENFIYEQLKLFSFGYIGENWHFVKLYIQNNADKFERLPDNTNWNNRLLTISFKAIDYLIKKDSWNEINQGVEQINLLRQELSLIHM